MADQLTDTPALTDAGNKERFVRQWAGSICYVTGLGWMTWDGKRWTTKGGDAAASRLAVKTAENIFDEGRQAMLDGMDELAKKLTAWCMQSQAANRVDAMLKLAKSSRRLRHEVDDLDADPWMLNCDNGVVDLRTGDLLAHDPARLITNLAPAIYDPGADVSRWGAFVESWVGEVDEDNGVADYLQRAAGMSLVGIPNKRLMLILQGVGRNGKTTMVEALKSALGDYAMTAAASALMRKRGGGASNDIAALRGARMVFASETADGSWLDAEVIKGLTGGSTQNCRFLYREAFDYTPQHTIWLDTNHRPKLRASDQATWDRIRTVRFPHRFEVDPAVGDSVALERDAILTWAVRGCLAWQRDGMRLREPATVTQETKGYRDSVDTVADFIAECCTLGDERTCRPADLASAYKEWSRQNGYAHLGTDRRDEELARHRVCKATTDGRREYRGLSVKPEALPKRTI